jgi:hypothetical protein
MPSIKIDIPDELAEKVERETIDSGDSRQKIIQSIIQKHYSLALVDPESRELQRKQELLDAALRENEILREHVELLRGVSVMIMTKQLLPVDDMTKPSWRVRLARCWPFGKK